MTAILKKELKTYFTSFFAYFYYALFFLVLGVCFVVNCLSTYSTQFGYYVLSKGFFVIAAVIPLCTMGLFAQEKRSKTDQMLFTAPVSIFSILLGKYLATFLFLFLPVALSCIYPVLIAGQGEMSVRFLMGVYIAIVLVGMSLLSLGMFISSMTSSVVLAAIITYGLYAVVLLGRILESVVSADGLYYFLHNFSIYNKYNDMVSGIVRSGDIAYLLLLSAGFFVLTWLRLDHQRIGNKVFAAKTVLLVACVCVLSGIFFHCTRVYDFTSEQLLTLSDETKEVVKNVEKQTDIYYMGERSRANATYQELFQEYKRLNDNIQIHYKNVETDLAFRQQYLGNVSAVTETSILVVCGDKYIYLDSADYVASIQTSKYSYKNILEIENQLTSAIYYTNSEDTSKICYITGHGEENLTSGFHNLLMMNSYDLDELNLAESLSSIEANFPESCLAVLLNAPQTDYSDDEIKALKQYMEDGGKLFVTIDPLNEELDNLYAFLADYGFDIEQGVIIEGEETNYAYDTAYYIIPKIQKNEITNPLIENNLHVLTMTSKGIKKNGEANGYSCTDLLTTSGRAFSKVSDFENATTKGENDISGPFSVASLSENKDGAKIFLLTSNIFFNEEVDMDSAGANRKFFLSVMDYLTGNDSGIMIPGKDVGNQTALYPNTAQTRIRIVAIVVVPFVILLIGVIVIIIRYKNIRFRALQKKKEEHNENEEV
ncbi:MAG: Gldg family protein [Lachnospiraceae bacterium]